MRKEVVKVCEECNKRFITIVPKKKYCNKNCRLLATEKARSRKGQPCWRCEHATNATGICPWSRELKPVDGWKAEPVMLHEIGHTYKISYCPLFKELEN